MKDVYLTPTKLYGNRWLYTVFVDGLEYDSFFSNGWITNLQMQDVAAGYSAWVNFASE